MKRATLKPERTLRKTWRMPAWMIPYLPILGNTVDEVQVYENCDGTNCNIEVNAPRALLCTAVQAKVQLLTRLHDKGLLGPVIEP